MRQLSLTESQELVNSFVKSFGQCEAARKLSEKGYRSPEGAKILQAHVYRIINGSGTCLLAPETENQQQEPPTTKEPIAAVPTIQKRIASELFEDEELLQKEIAETALALKQELIEEQLALREMERSMPPLVPSIGEHPGREARHLEQDIRVSAVFNKRQAVEFKTDDEGYEESYFGIPCMHHSSTTICRPYQPRQYGRNTLSTRDLSVHQK
jgi:hypothetical protein